MKITGFFHVWPRRSPVGEIVEEVKTTIERSGLLMHTEEFFTCIVNRNRKRPIIKRNWETEVSIKDDRSEWPTLEKIWEYCTENKKRLKEDHFILYVHTKGTHRNPTRSDIAGDWRRMMLYFCVTRWREALSFFDDSNVYAIGCNLANNTPKRKWIKRRPECRIENPQNWIFSGNFWWARANKIPLLPYPYSEETYKIVTHCGRHRRFQAESWIGLWGPDHMRTLHDSKTNHYRRPYPPEKYVIRDSESSRQA